MLICDVYDSNDLELLQVKRKCDWGKYFFNFFFLVNHPLKKKRVLNLSTLTKKKKTHNTGKWP